MHRAFNETWEKAHAAPRVAAARRVFPRRSNGWPRPRWTAASTPETVVGQPNPVGPIDGRVVPRYTGLSTFARLPRVEDVAHVDVAVLGVPFDSGRQLPPRRAVRSRPHPPVVPAAPTLQPRSRRRHRSTANRWPTPATSPATRSASARRSARSRWRRRRCSNAALASSRSAAITPSRCHCCAPCTSATARVAVLHFDAHLDTWDTYFGEPYTHGTPFRRASEEGLIDLGHSMHVGIRGPLYDRSDLVDTRAPRLHHDQLRRDRGARRRRDRRTHARASRRGTGVRLDRHRRPRSGARAGNGHARGRRDDQPRVARHHPRPRRSAGSSRPTSSRWRPPYDHAEITGIAAAHVAYELLSVMAPPPSRRRDTMATATDRPQAAKAGGLRGPLDRLRAAAPSVTASSGTSDRCGS